jgi:hypothetical protein
MGKVIKFFSWRNYLVSYIIVGVIAVASYYFVRQMFIANSAWSFIKTSQITFNLVILFGLWGGFHHLLIKTKSPVLNIVVLIAGFILIFVILKLAGLRTIWG